ncbi:MAG TPA: O-antigen ligase family protein [Gammaproteobacteria bacterium]|nr:O-antigen ligase family protein [Gammaproteobacteria bacterium]
MMEFGDSRRSSTASVLFLGLLLLIAWLPVPLGSNRVWSAGLMHAATMVLLGLWCLRYVGHRGIVTPALRNAKAAVVLLVLWLVYVALQLCPMPPALLAVVSPKAFEHYSVASAAGYEPFSSLSLDPGSTLAMLQKFAAYVALLFLTLVLLISRRRLRLMLAVLTLVGTVEAFYGILAYVGRGHFVLWYPGIAGNSVSGTYVNRNHFAGLMEVTIPAAIGLLIARSTLRYGRGGREALRSGMDFLLKDTGWVSFCLLIMCTALILSTSRGGVAALVFSIGFAVTLAVFCRSGPAAESRVPLKVGVLALVGVAWLGAGGIVEKLENVGFANNRGDIREAIYAMVGDFWLTGSGAGTFQWVFPAYKTEALGGGYYEHAHNDFLELLSEQGVIGLILAGGAICILLFKIISAYLRRRDPLMRGALFFSLCGASSLLAHGLVDFNLNIPANAALFFVSLGVGLVAADLERGGRRDRERYGETMTDETTRKGLEPAV